MSQLIHASTEVDWQVLCQVLPPGWEDAAHEFDAFHRARGVPDVTTPLRILSTHLADGGSLRETATRVEQAGWASLSAVALFERLRAAGPWLRWMAERLWRPTGTGVTTPGYRVRAVDATAVRETGSTGTDWRVHDALDLANLECDFFGVTDASEGETFRRVPITPGDLVLGDRVYGTPPGVESVAARGGEVLVRVNQTALPVWDPRGRRFPYRTQFRGLRVRRVAEWPTRVRGSQRTVPGRLIAVELGGRAARVARDRMQRRARRRQSTVSPGAVYLAGFVLVWTTVPVSVRDASAVLALYRVRWQIELAFKRMKSLMGLGQLPKESDASSRAWLHGKLFLALLVGRLLALAESFSPRSWGGSPAESMA